MTIRCRKCESLGMTFQSTTVNPDEYIEGPINSKIWIIGINPKGDTRTITSRSKEEFQNFDPSRYSYFRDFKKVSESLYANWKSSSSIVAHTDLVKCFSQSFPPKINDRFVDREQIILNCKGYLLIQIIRHKPKIIICNGTSVCREMINFFPPENGGEPYNKLTSYKTTCQDDNNNNFSFWILLSGFIGRIDDRNKRRLGKEIEKIIEEEEIKL